jgi:uncharacterized membrane protein
MPLARHLPFLLAALAGVLGLGSWFWLPGDMAIAIAGNAFFITFLALSLLGVHKLTKNYLRKHAASSDAPVWLIFLVTLGAVAVSSVSLFQLINAAQAPPGYQFALALAALPLGWFTIHVMAAIHYAHMFWQPDTGNDTARRGLEFPGTSEPEGWDFVYFATVIGMTAQTSDVQITGAHMRRFNLAHAIASYFFNTVLVAAAVNLAVSLQG